MTGDVIMQLCESKNISDRVTGETLDGALAYGDSVVFCLAQIAGLLAEINENIKYLDPNYCSRMNRPMESKVVETKHTADKPRLPQF